MTLEAFAVLVQDNVKEYLPASFADAETEIRHVCKNNGLRLTGISIRRKDRQLAPTVYVNELHEEFENGRSLDEILCRIACTVMKEQGNLSFDVNDLVSLDSCMDKIYPKVINTEMNQEILAERPHREVADLSVTYQITLENEEIGIGSIAVTNSLMELWEITEEELNAIAIRNLEKQEVILKSLTEMISELMGDMGGEDPFDEDISGTIGMYVLTHKSKLNGANIILNKPKMKEISEMGNFRNGFYILPSSTSELLLVPKTDNVNAQMLSDLVKDVNQTSVERELRLSDNVYTYDIKSGLQISA